MAIAWSLGLPDRISILMFSLIPFFPFFLLFGIAEYPIVVIQVLAHVVLPGPGALATFPRSTHGLITSMVHLRSSPSAPVISVLVFSDHPAWCDR